MASLVGVFAAAIAYDLLRMPVQVFDSLELILDAQRSSSAWESFRGAISDHGVAAVEKAAAVAVKAAEETKPMLALRGRAAYTGERSRGSVDAGATAVGVILSAISAAWRDRHNDEEAKA